MVIPLWVFIPCHIRQIRRPCCVFTDGVAPKQPICFKRSYDIILKADQSTVQFTPRENNCFAPTSDPFSVHGRQGIIAPAAIFRVVLLNYLIGKIGVNSPGAVWLAVEEKWVASKECCKENFHIAVL